MKLNDILMALSSLSAKDRSTLLAALNALGPPTKSQAADPTLVLYEALDAVMKGTLPFSAFKATRAHQAWKRDAANVIGFSDELWPEAKDSKNLQRGVLVFLLSLVQDDLVRSRIPASLTMMVSNLSRVGPLFEREFPGYRESGLTSMILSNISKGTNGRPKIREKR